MGGAGIYVWRPLKDDFFSQLPETDFRHETEARKVIVDFKFDALYR